MNKIFYFTGTGNCLRISQIIGTSLGETELVRITGETGMDYQAEPGAVVGVIYPVLCGNAPEIVRRFVAQMKLPSDTFFFGIATHGGHVVIGREQIAEIVNAKGHTNNAFYEIEMIHNGAFVAPLPDEATIKKVTGAAYEKAEELARKIRVRELNPIPEAHEVIEKMAQNPMARMVVLSFHPNDMGKLYFLNGDCIQCGTCVRVCPMENITLKIDGPVWGPRCEMCNACLQWCPRKIIQFSKTDVAEHTSVGNGRYHNPDVKLSDLIVRRESAC